MNVFIHYIDVDESRGPSGCCVGCIFFDEDDDGPDLEEWIQEKFEEHRNADGGRWTFIEFRLNHPEAEGAQEGYQSIEECQHAYITDASTR